MKIINTILFIFFTSFSNLFAENSIKFDDWKKKFKILALKNNISERTFDKVMSNVKFLPNVIKWF